jgi:hypothetical protein
VAQSVKWIDQSVYILVKLASISAGTVADLAEVGIEGIPESWPRFFNVNWILTGSKDIE